MSTITIRNVPDDLRRRLEAQARAHRRTLDEEALTVLDDAVSRTAATSKEEAIARIDALREKIGPVSSDLDPAALIREDRDSDHGREST